jgi:hypothetical protein
MLFVFMFETTGNKTVLKPLAHTRSSTDLFSELQKNRSCETTPSNHDSGCEKKIDETDLKTRETLSLDIATYC